MISFTNLIEGHEQEAQVVQAHQVYNTAQSTTSNPINPLMYSIFQIHTVPCLNIGMYGEVYISIVGNDKYHSLHRYLLSNNLMGIIVNPVIYTGNQNTKTPGRISDGIIRIKFGDNTIYLRRKKITGQYLIQKLSQIGVDFCIDAPMNKRGEALTQLLDNSLRINNCIIIDSIDDWKTIEDSCED